MIYNQFKTSEIQNPYLNKRFVQDMQIAEKHGLGEQLWNSAKQVGGAGLSLLGKVLRPLSLPSNVIAGIMSPKYSVWDAVKKNVSPSDVFWKEYMGDRNPGFLKRLAVDVVLDPLTYVSFGAASTTRSIATEAGYKVLNKSGVQVWKDTVDNFAQTALAKSADNVATGVLDDAGKMALKYEAINKTDDFFRIMAEKKPVLSQSDLELAKQGLQAMGKEVTDANVMRIVSEGIPNVWDKGGFKIFGKSIISGDDAVNFVNKLSENSPRTKAFFDWTSNVKNAITSPFTAKIEKIKDVKLKDTVLQSFKNISLKDEEAKKTVNALCSGLSDDEMKQIVVAIDKATVQELPEKLRNVAGETQKVMRVIANDEMSRGILDSTWENYITHLYGDAGQQALKQIGGINKDWIKATTRFAKERDISTLELAEKLGLKPEYDLRKILYSRLMASHRAIIEQDFAKSLAELRGVKRGMEETTTVLKDLNYKELSNLPEFQIARSNLMGRGVKVSKENVVDEIKRINPDTNISKEVLKTLKKDTPEFTDLVLSGRMNDYVRLTDVFAGLPKLTKAKDKNIQKTLTSLGKAMEGGDVAKISELEGKLATYKLGQDAAKYFDELKDVYVPRSAIEAYSELVTQPLERAIKDEATSWLKAYDKGISWFKRMVTIPHVGFHTRNIYGNVTNSFLEAGLSSLNPKNHSLAINLMTGKEFEAVSDLGETLTGKLLHDEAKKFGVWSSDMVQLDKANELGILSKPAKGLDSVLNKLEKAAGSIETEARLNLFITKRMQGFSASAAADSVRKTLFDYSLLSGTERTVLKRIFPFYTWRSRNFTFQLHNMLSKPGTFMNYQKLVDGLQTGIGQEKLSEDEKKYLPQYMLGKLFINYHRSNNKISIVDGLSTPIDDFTSMLDNPGKEIVNWMAPWIKIPLEGVTGTNFFTGRKISEQTGGDKYVNLPPAARSMMDFAEYVDKDGVSHYTVNGEKAWLFDSLTSLSGFNRFIGQSGYVQTFNSTYDMLKGDKPFSLTTTSSLLQLLSGANIKEQDIEKLQYIYERQEIDAFESELKRRGLIDTFTRTYETKGTKLVQ